MIFIVKDHMLYIYTCLCYLLQFRLSFIVHICRNSDNHFVLIVFCIKPENKLLEYIFKVESMPPRGCSSLKLKTSSMSLLSPRKASNETLFHCIQIFMNTCEVTMRVKCEIHVGKTTLHKIPIYYEYMCLFWVSAISGMICFPMAI